MPPLTVEEECIEVLKTYAQPISRWDRPRFLERVDELMRGVEAGPGAYARACARAQSEFLNAPAVDAASPRPAPPQLRSPHKRRRA
jgi:hypothetical protein